MRNYEMWSSSNPNRTKNPENREQTEQTEQTKTTFFLSHKFESDFTAKPCLQRKKKLLRRNGEENPE